jgi:chromosome partitioning protein
MAARIIVVANQKGGAGKTTTAMQLSAALALNGTKVLVVDADAQGTATRWAGVASDAAPFPAPVVNLAQAGKSLHREIRKHIENYQYIVVDCPPSVESPAPQSALLVADLVLVPVIPSPPDLWAALGIRHLIENASTVNETLQPFLVANMVQGTSLGREVLQILDDFGVPLLKSKIGLRTAYRQSAVYGSSVFGIGSAAKVAIEEVLALRDEVLERLGEKAHG